MSERCRSYRDARLSIPLKLNAVYQDVSGLHIFVSVLRSFDFLAMYMNAIVCVWERDRERESFIIIYFDRDRGR